MQRFEGWLNKRFYGLDLLGLILAFIVIFGTVAVGAYLDGIRGH